MSRLLRRTDTPFGVRPVNHGREQSTVV